MTEDRIEGLNPVQKARIKRRQAHAAAAAIGRIQRAPEMDRIRAFASLQARKANLTYAILRGTPLDKVETAPRSNSRATKYFELRNKIVKSLGLRKTTAI